jgi:hypothetical protein
MLMRPRRRADLMALEALRPKWRGFEVPPPDRSLGSATVAYVLESRGRLVGELRGVVPSGSDTLFATGATCAEGLEFEVPDLPDRIVACRSRDVRRLGLKHLVSLVPLRGYAVYEAIYQPAGYVQQVMAMAIEEPLLEAYLRIGARVTKIIDAPLPVAELMWEDRLR